MGWLEAALLGLVQGLTEFLPVSSTAHLLILQEALGRWLDQYPHVSVETQVVHGHPASVLAAAAKAADVLVVRRAHESRPLDHLGATVRALLLSSPAPVEVVPSRAGPGPTGDGPARSAP